MSLDVLLQMVVEACALPPMRLLCVLKDTGASAHPQSPPAMPAVHTNTCRVLEFAFARHRPANGPGNILGCSSVLDAALRAHDPYSSSMGPGMGVQLSEAEDTDNVAITSARLIDAAMVKLGKQLRSLEGLVLKVGWLCSRDSLMS